MTEDLQKPAMPDTHEQLTFVLKLAALKDREALIGTITTYYQVEVKRQRRTYSAPRLRKINADRG